MAAKERGLGKGLDALMGDSSLQTQENGSVLLPISRVEPGLKQPRKRFDEEAISDLADSIRTYGVIQPLTVRRLSSGYYQIIAGERRWRAAKQAGLAEVPAIIIEADDRKVMELGLVENLQRQDLNPMEEAAGYQSLMQDYGLTQNEVSQRVGKSRSAVTNALRLMDLPDAVQYMVEEGKLSAGHARALLSAKLGGGAVKSLAMKVVEGGLSVRQTEALVKKFNQEAQTTEEAEELPHPDPMKMYRDSAAKDLSARLGRKVSIVQGAKHGELKLQYYDYEDLTLLLDLLEKLPGAPKGGYSR